MRYPMGTHWGPLGIKAKKSVKESMNKSVEKSVEKLMEELMKIEDSPLLGFPKGVGGWTPKYVICSVLQFYW